MRRQQVNIHSNSSTHRAIKYNVQPATPRYLSHTKRVNYGHCNFLFCLLSVALLSLSLSLCLSRSALLHSLIIMQAKRFAKVLLAAFAYFDMQAQRVKLIFNSHPGSTLQQRLISARRPRYNVAK